MFFLILTYHASSLQLANRWTRLGSVAIILAPLGVFQFVSSILPKLPEKILNRHRWIFFPRKGMSRPLL